MGAKILREIIAAATPCSSSAIDVVQLVVVLFLLLPARHVSQGTQSTKHPALQGGLQGVFLDLRVPGRVLTASAAPFGPRGCRAEEHPSRVRAIRSHTNEFRTKWSV